MRFARRAAALIPVSLALAVNQSTYTSIRPVDCTAPASQAAAAFKARGLGAQECRAPEGWRLFVVASDSNTWLEIRSRTTTWSAEDAIVYDDPVGLFPSAAGSPRVEWRRTDGRVIALIFRVTAQQESDTRSRVTRLFVVRLEPRGACLIGRVRTNEEARALADSAQACAPK